MQNINLFSSVRTNMTQVTYIYGVLIDLNVRIHTIFRVYFSTYFRLVTLIVTPGHQVAFTQNLRAVCQIFKLMVLIILKVLYV